MCYLNCSITGCFCEVNRNKGINEDLELENVSPIVCNYNPNKDIQGIIIVIHATAYFFSSGLELLTRNNGKLCWKTIKVHLFLCLNELISRLLLAAK